tara:strand:- start:2842 stop:3108 length:267 start_codon:yes stop_codon:yes gene_type:complete
LLLQAKDGVICKFFIQIMEFVTFVHCLHFTLQSQTVSLKKYLFFDREIGRDGKVIGWWVMFERLAQLIGLVFTDDIMRRFKGDNIMTL